MYINTISSMMRPIKSKPVKVITEVGKFKDYNIAIRKEFHNNELIEKQFVFWNSNVQKIVNKCKNSQGIFEKIG